MFDYSMYLLYKLFVFVVRHTPKVIVKPLLFVLAYLAYMIDRKHVKVAKVNLGLAYGNEKTKEEKRKIIIGSYVNLAFNLYEFIENQEITLEEFEKKVTVENEHILLDALQNGRKIIIITAHYGNWELIGSYFGSKYAPMTTVGRMLNNKYLNDSLLEGRNKHNNEMLEKQSAAKGLMKALKDHRIVGLVVDQNTSEKMGEMVDFFGKHATQTDAPAKLAEKFDAVIIPVFAVMNSFGNYTMKMYEPIEISKIEAEDKIFVCTQMQADVIEAQIREKPEIWFWQHRRWKNQYKHIYVE